MSTDQFIFLAYGFAAGSIYACFWVWFWGRKKQKATPRRTPNHFHSLGFGVSTPCDDERCPEWRTP